MINRTVYHKGDISTLVGGDIIILGRQLLTQCLNVATTMVKYWHVKFISSFQAEGSGIWSYYTLDQPSRVLPCSPEKDCWVLEHLPTIGHRRYDASVVSPPSQRMVWNATPRGIWVYVPSRLSQAAWVFGGKKKHSKVECLIFTDLFGSPI